MNCNTLSTNEQKRLSKSIQSVKEDEKMYYKGQTGQKVPQYVTAISTELLRNLSIETIHW